jgi:predicted phage-related endonuclease
MKILEGEQGSYQWLQNRAGIPTASEFKNLLTDGMQIRKWSTEMPLKFLALKLAEKWTGHAQAEDLNTFAIEQGRIVEERARPWYALTYGVEVKKVGLCVTDDGRAGCSPDGLIGEDEGIEIKSPYAKTHVAYLLAGELPTEYAAQVHGSLYVTGRPRWNFLSFRMGFPKFVIVVERDEEIIGKIGVALAEFNDRFDAGWKKLCEANGGPPPPRVQDNGTYEQFRRNLETQANQYEGVTP